MGLRKFNRWIDKENYITGLKIAQKYYKRKEMGLSVSFLSPYLLWQYIKRISFVLVNISRFDKTSYQEYKNPRSLKELLFRILGFYKISPRQLSIPKVFNQLQIPQYSNPQVSIIISIANEINYTYNCLLTILENTGNISFEIIFVTKSTAAKSIAFLNHIHANGKIVTSCNEASDLAIGSYLCFLDNDVQVKSYWLENMLSTFRYFTNTGIVGARLVYPYGLIKETGISLNSTGELNFPGRFKAPHDFYYNYIRETTACSRTCLLIKKYDFNLAGKFSERFQSRLMEDVDLSMTLIAKLNKKCYYQPLTKVISFESCLSKHFRSNLPGDSDKRMFLQKWQNNIQISPITDKKESILVMDAVLPKPDQDSGSRRMFEIIKLFKCLGYDVYFMAHEGLRIEPYYSNLVKMGIKVISGDFPKEKLHKKLSDIIPEIDLMWISRPEMNEIYGRFVKQMKNIPWIYDTVDLHFIRLQRALELSGTSKIEIEQKIDPVRIQELTLAEDADHTLTVTEVERQVLIAQGIKNVSVIPNIHFDQFSTQKSLSFDERKDLVFIGSYQHQPNIDAALWLSHEIMPLVWKYNSAIKLYLLGSKPTPEISALQSDRVEVPGFVHDVSDYFMKSRIFVAPLRYGAGMKGKIGQSLEYGLPIISTHIGVEGMGLIDGHNVLLAETASNFANKILELYESPELWTKIKDNSLAAIQDYLPENVEQKLKIMLTQLQN